MAYIIFLPLVTAALVQYDSRYKSSLIQAYTYHLGSFEAGWVHFIILLRILTIIPGLNLIIKGSLTRIRTLVLNSNPLALAGGC